MQLVMIRTIIMIMIMTMILIELVTENKHLDLSRIKGLRGFNPTV